jgi:hypothetical protein
MMIPKTLRKYAHMIESIDDERGIQNGYWVNLRPGYETGNDKFSPTHQIHEDTIKTCADALYDCVPCNCADCKKEAA